MGIKLSDYDLGRDISGSDHNRKVCGTSQSLLSPQPGLQQGSCVIEVGILARQSLPFQLQ